jgi:prepilin-type N-terminal cleavage/methylation domain-containing protein
LVFCFLLHVLVGLYQRNFSLELIMQNLTRKTKRRPRAFTLIELLTVIAIIAILAALLLAVVVHSTVEADKTKAKLQTGELVTAIQKYDSDYSHLPVTTSEQTAAGAGDFTFGGAFQTSGGTSQQVGTPVSGSVMNNSEVIAILMDLTSFPNGAPTDNNNYVENPQRNLYLNAKMGDAYNTKGVVGPDLVYRDPWGNPYVISLDVNYDDECEDALYRLPIVAQDASGNGIDGLVKQPDGNYAIHSKVMVWSAGPDKKVDPDKPANQSANKDNILNWVP